MRLSLTLIGALCCVACRRDMQDQPRDQPLKASRVFADGRASRSPVEGTVARGHLRPREPFYTGRRAGVAPQPIPLVPTAAGMRSAKAELQAFSPDLVQEIPVTLTDALLRRGQERFGMYCSPCHGLSGHGDGIVVQRGFLAPPSYHSERLRNAPAGHFFEVITNGYGAMYSYAARASVPDRWAITAYVRALQYSQWQDLTTIPGAEQQRLETEAAR